MATCNRVVAALNFLTGEGIDYYPDHCDDKSIEALILIETEMRMAAEAILKKAQMKATARMKVLHIKILVRNYIIANEIRDYTRKIIFIHVL